MKCDICKNEIPKGINHFLVSKMGCPTNPSEPGDLNIMDNLNICKCMIPPQFVELLSQSLDVEEIDDEEDDSFVEENFSSISNEKINPGEIFYIVSDVVTPKHYKSGDAIVQNSIVIKGHEMPEKILKCKKWKVKHDKNGNVESFQ